MVRLSSGHLIVDVVLSPIFVAESQIAVMLAGDNIQHKAIAVENF